MSIYAGNARFRIDFHMRTENRASVIKDFLQVNYFCWREPLRRPQKKIVFGCGINRPAKSSQTIEKLSLAGKGVADVVRCQQKFVIKITFQDGKGVPSGSTVAFKTVLIE